ncbi:class I SAM-dependent methyltransferase [Burkholderia ubonensis]|uniref:class I SAM-dependent methyltransferase n=1 Tax=Burkholderia ubonensis TaxID=101571 RepID=UPI000751BDA5|nr:class I SAM-dependent methyltransferase [Burkholderia ubonensis]KVL13174.1 SAM-dependent methyltransferase [Burkholderia ubonensis]KVQ49479.1 SAM-dependent methyltransferase [Burkholderia ubonensis]
MKIVDTSLLKQWYSKEYGAGREKPVFGSLRREMAAFLDAIPAAAESALELGCGDGRNLAALAGKGLRLTGVDMVDSLAVTRRSISALSDMTFVQTDILDYEPEREAFDVVVCSEVLHFFTKNELAQVMPKILDAVKPGGLLFVDLLSDLTRHFAATGEPFVWDKEAGISVPEAETLFKRWLTDFDVSWTRHFFDQQTWPLTDAIDMPIPPYVWQGTYVSVCAHKRTREVR